MQIITAPKNLIYDAVVIGSGAGGGPVAMRLSQAGWRVLVLEKGEYLPREDVDKDEVALSRRRRFKPDLSREYQVVHYSTPRDAKGRAPRIYRGWDMWNGSLVGGSAQMMSAFFHRLKPADFALKSTYGEIAGANVADWPIKYADFEPFYAAVERIAGVSGQVQPHRFAEPRSTANFPYPKLAENPITARFDAACRSLGITPLATPRGIISEPKDGRAACYYSGFCGGYPCASGAKVSGITFLNLSDAEVLPGAFAYRLEAGKKGVSAVHFYDKNGKSHSVRARHFIVAAQAIESVRLLLNSASADHPGGLGNSSGQLGKNLIFSAGGVGGGEFAATDELMTHGLFFNRNVQDFYELDGKKGGLIDFLFAHGDIVPRVAERFWEGERLVWGEALREKVAAVNATRRVDFEVFCDWLPTDDSYITVGAERDFMGVPVAHAHIRAHTRDLEVGEVLSQKATQILRQMGASNITSTVSAAPTPNLQAGGARFGADPSTSVLSPECRAHDLSNLWISDAAFMPTGGSVPYTLTIMANSLRVAEAVLGSK